jgi:biotin carboxyl carrier protein
VHRGKSPEAPRCDDDDDRGTNVATKIAGTVPTAVRDTQASQDVYELRSSSEGTVIRVEVDEGQMVAEDDEIALLETENGRVAVVTDVPGVVRELYVEAGYSVTPGTVIALIDES